MKIPSTWDEQHALYVERLDQLFDGVEPQSDRCLIRVDRDKVDLLRDFLYEQEGADWADPHPSASGSSWVEVTWLGVHGEAVSVRAQQASEHFAAWKLKLNGPEAR